MSLSLHFQPIIRLSFLLLFRRCPFAFFASVGWTMTSAVVGVSARFDVSSTSASPIRNDWPWFSLTDKSWKLPSTQYVFDGKPGNVEKKSKVLHGTKSRERERERDGERMTEIESNWGPGVRKNIGKGITYWVLPTTGQQTVHAQRESWPPYSRTPTPAQPKWIRETGSPQIKLLSLSLFLSVHKHSVEKRRQPI